jgi:hypothetical protein
MNLSQRASEFVLRFFVNSADGGGVELQRVKVHFGAA